MGDAVVPHHACFHDAVRALLHDDPPRALRSVLHALRIESSFVAAVLVLRLLYRCYPAIAPRSARIDICDSLTQRAKAIHAHAQDQTFAFLLENARIHLIHDPHRFHYLTQSAPAQTDIDAHFNVEEQDTRLPIPHTYTHNQRDGIFPSCFTSAVVRSCSIQSTQDMTDSSSPSNPENPFPSLQNQMESNETQSADADQASSTIDTSLINKSIPSNERDIGVLYVFLLGYYLDLVRQDTNGAFRIYRYTAARGLVYAEIFLGWSYYNGFGVERDEKSAARWFSRSAAAGFPNSLNLLGVCYTLGRGVPKDPHEALHCYHDAAEMGYPDAAYNLALCFYHGHGVARSQRLAVAWLRIAARRGFADAQSLLSSFLFHGIDGSEPDADSGVIPEAQAYGYRGMEPVEPYVNEADVESMIIHVDGVTIGGSDTDPVMSDTPDADPNSRNMTEGLMWARLAADQGDTEAMVQIAMSYFHGSGVTADHREAVRWVRRAAGNVDDARSQQSLQVRPSEGDALGNPYAAYLLAVCYRQGMGIRLNLREARRWAQTAAARGSAEGRKILLELALNTYTPGACLTDLAASAFAHPEDMLLDDALDFPQSL
eukprot:TRINITY_DN1915_c0_g1_i1.p1 TRINITY_DN1915_c0_g1~~TRINITY_DN1915_c0_g1_i1.p1  ORF type:complete len:647 (+),score=129.62 TRINITY_DN1915_c0_g1_i1:143-1942(+)